MRKRGGVSNFSVENFLSQSAESFVGNPLVFHYFRVWKKFRDKTGGVNHDFLSKVLSFIVAKIFVGELFCVSQKFWYRKTLWMRGWGDMSGVSQFSADYFLSHIT